jgi:hypothetical protein
MAKMNVALAQSTTLTTEALCSTPEASKRQQDVLRVRERMRRIRRAHNGESTIPPMLAVVVDINKE